MPNILTPGTRVRLKAHSMQEKIDYPPEWVEEMDEYENEIVTIANYIYDNQYHIKEDDRDYVWHISSFTIAGYTTF